MMITFAITVPPGTDLDDAEQTLRESAETFLVRGVLSGSFDPMPTIVVERTTVPRFVPTGNQIMLGLEVVPEITLQAWILLEAKAEVDE